MELFYVNGQIDALWLIIWKVIHTQSYFFKVIFFVFHLKMSMRCGECIIQYFLAVGWFGWAWAWTMGSLSADISIIRRCCSGRC